MSQPFIINKKDRTIYDVLGDRYTVLLSATETDNAYSLFEFEVPKGHGSPPHIHTLEDESFYILSGEVDFMIDGKMTRAKTGDVIFGPRGIAHNFTGASEQPARLICMTSPGGFENFFAAVGTLVSDLSIAPSPPSEQDIDRLIRLAPEFGLKILLPEH